MKAIDEKNSVDTSPTELVGGARAEPEERPVITTFKVEGGEKADSGSKLDVNLMAGNAVRLETDVAEFQLTFGKICFDCKHFNLLAGQAALERMAYSDKPEERRLVTETFTELQLAGEVPSTYVQDGEDIFTPTPAEIAMSNDGLCRRMTEFYRDTVLTFPDAHCGAIREGHGDFWEAKNSDVAKRVAQMRDELMITADVKP